VSSSSPAAVASRRARGDRDRGEHTHAALERAIVQTVAYADVFDYPLTLDEVHRYLIGVPASRGSLRAALAVPPRGLSRSGRYFTLAGRESVVETRRRRAAISAAYWKRAVYYGRLIGSLPFVRMVAVTGALAMDNVADADIDYLVITEPGRLWLARGLVVGIVHAAAARGATLCPNYFLSERALVLDERNLFTAHEVTQMVPLAGSATYARLRALNQWTDQYLPNAGGPPRRQTVPASEPGQRHHIRALAEHALRSPIGAGLERWERARKMRKLGRRGDGHAEAAFGPDWCKGHFDDHGRLTLSRYAERLAHLEAARA
jgi:hypothetical protein